MIFYRSNQFESVCEEICFNMEKTRKSFEVFFKIKKVLLEILSMRQFEICEINNSEPIRRILVFKE